MFTFEVETNKLLAGTTTLICCPLEYASPAVNGDTATAYGPDAPSEGVVAPAGDVNVASENAPAADTAARVTATRLAACRMDIELLLDGWWLRWGCCVVVKANVRVFAYFGGPLKVKPQVTRRKHLHVRDRPHVVHRRVTGVARGGDLP
jgi:hypothetical protein